VFGSFLVPLYNLSNWQRRYAETPPLALQSNLR